MKYSTYIKGTFYDKEFCDKYNAIEHEDNTHTIRMLIDYYSLDETGWYKKYKCCDYIECWVTEDFYKDFYTNNRWDDDENIMYNFIFYKNGILLKDHVYKNSDTKLANLNEYKEAIDHYDDNHQIRLFIIDWNSHKNYECWITESSFRYYCINGEPDNIGYLFTYNGINIHCNMKEYNKYMEMAHPEIMATKTQTTSTRNDDFAHKLSSNLGANSFYANFSSRIPELIILFIILECIFVEKPWDIPLFILFILYGLWRQANL